MIESSDQTIAHSSNPDTMNKSVDINAIAAPWLVEDLNPTAMAAVSGGAILRRKALNRWTFQFQQNTLNITNIRVRVTDLLTDVSNRQANIDLSNQFHRQLTALEGNRQLADNLYRAVGLPVPN